MLQGHGTRPHICKSRSEYIKSGCSTSGKLKIRVLHPLWILLFENEQMALARILVRHNDGREHTSINSCAKFV